MEATAEQIIVPDRDLTASDRRFDTEWGNPRTYLEQYYPPLETDPKFVLDISAKYVQLRRKNGNKVDINEFRSGDPNISLTDEVIENYLLLDFLARVNLEYAKAHPGLRERIVNNGAGPVAYPFMALAGIAEEIIPGEYLEANRQEIDLWRTRDPRSYDWSTYTKVSSILNGHYLNPILSYLPAESQTRVRQVTNDVSLDDLAHALTKSPEYINFFNFPQSTPQSHLDTNKDLLGFPKNAMAATFFGPESATVDREQWQKAMDYFMRDENTGGVGWVLLTTINGASSYSVGGNELPAVNITHQDLVNKLQDRDYEMVISEEITGSDIKENHYCGMSFILARPQQAAFQRMMQEAS